MTSGWRSLAGAGERGAPCGHAGERLRLSQAAGARRRVKGLRVKGSWGLGLDGGFYM
jgi:hypothetical protein